jgi:hypothetical protein
MNGLPDDFDPVPLLGRTLEQVSFTENQVILHFSDGLHITIENSFSYQKDSSSAFCHKLEVPVKQSDLMQLLGHSIINVVDEGEGTLRISFENGATIKCYDPLGPYESYHISYPGKTIHV